MKFQDLGFSALVWGFFSVLPWFWVVYRTFPNRERFSISGSDFAVSRPRLILGTVLGFAAGIACTYLILQASPLLWPEVDIKPQRPKSILTQTIHLAFIQAGMMEEAFKCFFITTLGILFFRSKKGLFHPGIFLLSGSVALGFAFIENSYYIISEEEGRRFASFLGRSIHSSNIHLLINLCFGLFFLKANRIGEGTRKIGFLFAGFGLAVIQHGVVDFFLIPSSNLGTWLSTAMFVGIWVWVVRDFRFLIQNTALPSQEEKSGIGIEFSPYQGV
jgi:RsiW-degrading membrane proteinase PrsW (M82 family)